MRVRNAALALGLVLALLAPALPADAGSKGRSRSAPAVKSGRSSPGRSARPPSRAPVRSVKPRSVPQSPVRMSKPPSRLAVPRSKTIPLSKRPVKAPSTAVFGGSKLPAPNHAGLRTKPRPNVAIRQTKGTGHLGRRHFGHHFGTHSLYYPYGYGFYYYPGLFHYGWPYYGYRYCWAWAWPYFTGGWYVGRPYDYGERYGPASTGALETDVKPKKAEVYVDGVFVGQARDYNGTWDLLWLEPGEYRVEFRYPGYMTLEVSVTIEAGGYGRVLERLQTGQGRDPRSSPTPVAAAVTDNPPQPAQGYIVDSPRNEPSREGTLRTGFLTIDAAPPDAAVYLDGEFLGRADELARLHGALPVARGRHVIEVVRPGFSSERVEVEVGDSEPAKVVVTLERGD